MPAGPPPHASATPPPPPDVTAQMGGTPQDPMQQAARQGMQQPANPAGGALAKMELVLKVLDQVGRELPAFGPFGDRAQQIIKAGMAEAAGAQAKPAEGIQAPGSQTGNPTLRPPSGGAGMPA